MYGTERKQKLTIVLFHEKNTYFKKLPAIEWANWFFQKYLKNATNFTECKKNVRVDPAD